MSKSQSTITTLETAKQFFSAISDNGDQLVVIDFYTTWCGPCKKIAPVMEEYSKKYPDVCFYKLDAENTEFKKICDACQITAFPTFCFFKGTKCLKKLEGANEVLLKEAIKAGM